MRARRMRVIVSLIEDAFERWGEAKILDVGGRRTYWSPLSSEYLRDRKVQITLLNLAEDLKSNDDEHFLHVAGDACNLSSFDDKEFHIVHSNSVIEHVGGWERMKKFAKETRRLGHGVYVQTPYFWFPIEPHYITPFFHWLPRPLQVRLVEQFTLGNRGRARNLDHAAELIDEAPRLLDFREYKSLYPDCTIISEKFLLLTKSMIAFRRIA